jgi:hypothetical protein
MFGCGSWGAERGESVVNRGNLCGPCVVIFVVEIHANLQKYLFSG